ncbi:hypothetical protein D3C78_957040 [compost metagenome]
MAIAQLTQALQESSIGRQHAAFALNRLDDHRAGVVVNHLGSGRQIVKWRVGDAARQWREVLGILRLATGRHGKQRAAVEGVVECHNLVLAVVAVIQCAFTRQFQRRFVGFCPGVTEKHLLGKGGVNQQLGQPQHRLVGIAVAQVPKFARLLHQRCGHDRVRMAQRVNRNAASKIDVRLTLLIPDLRTFSPYQNKISGGVNRDHPVVERLAGNCDWLFHNDLITSAKAEFWR